MSYLDRLKTTISENGHVTPLTELTKAPSVSSVSDQGWCVSENERVDDAPTSYWSDVLHERFWLAFTAAHDVTLAAQGQVAYLPEEIWYLRDLKARDPQNFTAKLRAIHKVKTLFGATVMGVTPAPVQVAP